MRENLQKSKTLLGDRLGLTFGDEVASVQKEALKAVVQELQSKGQGTVLFAKKKGGELPVITEQFETALRSKIEALQAEKQKCQTEKTSSKFKALDQMHQQALDKFISKSTPAKEAVGKRKDEISDNIGQAIVKLNSLAARYKEADEFKKLKGESTSFEDAQENITLFKEFLTFVRQLTDRNKSGDIEQAQRLLDEARSRCNAVTFPSLNTDKPTFSFFSKPSPAKIINDILSGVSKQISSLNLAKPTPEHAAHVS